MAKDKKIVTLEIDEELLEQLDQKIEKLTESGAETDRSKHIRNLIRKDVAAASHPVAA